VEHQTNSAVVIRAGSFRSLEKARAFGMTQGLGMGVKAGAGSDAGL